MKKNPERIKVILDIIKEAWDKNPELRLCQLIGNCFEIEDLYYVEDERLVATLLITYLKR